MIFAAIGLEEIGGYILAVSFPILALYIAYLILTKAFEYMDFSSLEAVIIVFGSFILGSGLIDSYVGISFANISLFTYDSWNVGINTGGALIPMLLSIYLFIKNKLEWKKLLIGILIVTIVTYLVTEPVVNSGIVSRYPYFLLPAFFASITSVVLLRKNFRKAAPFAYISGTIGVLIGADVFHLWTLLNMNTSKGTNAVIGGADVFDMVFITGILAVLIDGFIMYRQRLKAGIQ